MKHTLLDSRCVIDQAGCDRNLLSTLARNLPILQKGPARDEPVAIVAAGPSVLDFLEEIREYKNVWAVNGAYDFLIGQDIIPNGFVGGDPLPGLAEYVKGHRPETTFYMSAQCDPAVFDAIPHNQVALWQMEQSLIASDKMPPWICGGTTAITRAPFVADYLGFRDITLYGCDSSFAKVEENGKFIGILRYCYPTHYAEDSTAKVNWIECNGEGPFPTEVNLAAQVSQLGDIERYWRSPLKIRCGGLMDAYLRAPVDDEDGVFAA